MSGSTWRACWRIVLIAAVSSITIASALSHELGVQHFPGRELMALGLSNLAVSLFAGCRTGR